MALTTSFVLLEDDWPCERGDRIVRGVLARWIVVHRIYQGKDLYYAFERRDVLARLSGRSGQPVGVALNLHETKCAPISAADTGPGDRPTVVVSRGRVAGVVPVPSPMFEHPYPTIAPIERSNAPGVARGIQASAPPEVALGDSVSLVVKLVNNKSSAQAIALTAAVGEQIDVVVQASGGLEVEGKADGVLTVAAAGTPMLLFKIAGTRIGPGEVSVLAFQRGQSVGSVDVAIQTVEKVSDRHPATAIAGLQAAPAQQPDLQLLVLENGSDASFTYTMWLVFANPELHANPAPFRFSLPNPREMLEKFYTDIETILNSEATAHQKQQRLGTKGTYLFQQLMPREVRETLWSLRSRIRSVHVQSQEPWVPWELIKPSGDDGSGTIIEAGFLCEDYEVTRWIPGIGYRPDLTMTKIGVVIPTDSGLAASSSERDTMSMLATPARQIVSIEAEEVALRNALAGGTFDAIHFTGHGTAGAISADLAEIRLEAGSRLRPEDLTGVAGNLKKRSPMIFLNACEIGRAGLGLTQPGGWPRAFLDAGAGAFVGPFWKVADASAASFAATFYQALLDGATVGAAARIARREVRAASDPTWLAYSVYAHSNARLT